MALSNKERQKRYRERRRKEKAKTAQPVSPPVRRSFSEFINSEKYRVEAFDIALKKLDPTRLGDWHQWIKKENGIETCREFIGDSYDGAIMAIATLCELVNEYKVEQIDARLLEIESAAKPHNPSLQEAADKFQTHLQSLRAEYQRPDRYSFMPLEIDGE